MSERTRNQRGRFMKPEASVASEPLDVRKLSQAKRAESLIKTGPITLVLVYADWCGHCHKYLPQWKEFGQVKNRTANIISVHHDMLENIPTVKNAKIQGYPSVIKVSPSGQITEYKVPNTKDVTNAMPHMRDMKKMIEEITKQEMLASDREVSKVLPNILSRISKNGSAMAGGCVMPALATAVQTAGPAALLLLAHGAVQAATAGKKTTTYKSPKKSSRRGSTRKQK